MGYQLGVDLGTTYSAAAIGRNGRVEMATLGTANPVLPSVVLLRADGEVLTGDIAVRRGQAEPTRVAREFKRRLGDPTPLVLGGTPYAAEALMGHLLRDIVRTITTREGEPPERVVLTHPATYGPYKLEQLREVARLGGLDLARTSFLTEPQAAAISYASRNRVDHGEIVAVYDLGGGTFDVALVQRTTQGFTIVGRPEGMERFGGIDIDAAIVAFVDQSLDGALSALDPNDPAVQAGMSRLRDDCRAAKEALSGDTDTTITVALPGLQTNVRLTRSELEDMVRPRLQETVEALERAATSAALTIDQISRILLVGGSSRMPLIGEFIRQRTGRPISVDAHPKFAIALGAAGLGQTRTLETSPPPTAAAPSPTPPSPTPPLPTPPGPTPPIPTSFAPQPATQRPPTGQRPPRTKTFAVVAAGISAVLIVALIAFLTTRDNGSTGTESRPPGTTTLATSTTGPTVTAVVSAATTTAVPASTASVATTAATTATTKPGPSGSLDAPLPVGTSFTSVDPNGIVGAWTGTVLGLVEVPSSTDNEDPGRCLVMLGTISPTAIAAGLLSSGFATPAVSLIVGGKVVDNETSLCDTTSIVAAGYSWLLDAAVTVGTDYPFYVELFLGSATPEEPQVIMLGNPSGSDVKFYSATELPSVPPTGELVFESAATGRELLPVGDPTASTFTYTDTDSQNVWTGELVGLVEASQLEGITDPGRCLVLVGTITSQTVATGIIADPQTQPYISLIASGRQVMPDASRCDTSAFDTAGYVDKYSGSAPGAAIAFRESFFLAGTTPGTPEVLVVGYPTGETQFLYEPTMIPAIPAL